MNDVLALILGGGRGTPSVPADAHALQAGGADRRQVSSHRRADQQLPARRPEADLRAHAVQLRVAQPPHRADVSSRHVLGRLRRSPRRRADTRQLRVVSGHGRRGAPGRTALRGLRRRVLSDPRRRSPLSDGLLRADRRAHREPRRHHDRRAAGHPTSTPPRWGSSGSTISARSKASRRSRPRIDWSR